MNDEQGGAGRTATTGIGMGRGTTTNGSPHDALATIRTFTVGPGISPSRLSNCLESSRAMTAGRELHPTPQEHSQCYDPSEAIAVWASVHSAGFCPCHADHAQQDQCRADELAGTHRLIQQEQ